MALFACKVGGSEGSSSKQLLFTGTKPFSAQTVSMDLSDYIGIVIEYNDNPTQQKNTGCYVDVGTSNVKAVGGYNTSGTTRGAYRTVSVSNTGVTIGDCTFSSTDTNNQYLTPVIYGIHR